MIHLLTSKPILSIRMRITLFYTLLTFCSCCVMLVLFLNGAKTTALAYDEDLLLEAMASAADTVAYENGLPSMHTHQAVDFGRVSFALFDEDGSLWHGQWPPFTLAYEDGTVRRITDHQGISQLCQDWLLPFPEGDLWLRGYIAADSMSFLRHSSAWRMLAILPVMLLLCIAGGLMITQRAFSPIAAMAQQADNIAGGDDLTQRFDTGHARRPDEIGQLAATFNRMFERLGAAFERERQFTNDASHELRTPVAVITSACDYALSQTDPEECRDALQVIHAKADTMSSMLSQLLQLARMDAGRSVSTQELIDLSTLCRETALETAKDSVKQLELDGIDQNLFLTGDELLLMRALINLLENALRYARTRVTVSLQQKDDALILRVADDGPGMTPEVAERVFDRFYQAAPDRSGTGAGLGLPMARSIAKLHGGSLSIECTGDSGTIFAMRLPFNTH